MDTTRERAGFGEVETDEPVHTGGDLVRLLDEQHGELREALDQLANLRGCARADVFLLLRRRLAVHQLLDEVVVVPLVAAATGREPSHAVAFDSEVAAAEGCDLDSEDFDRSVEQIRALHRSHVVHQELEVLGHLDGPLTEEQAAAVATAQALWSGEGEVYLGNSYGEMTATAREQLRHPSDPWHADGDD